MSTLTDTERDLLAPLGDAGPAMLSDVMEWSAQNSGSRNAAGLAAMRGRLAGAFAALPGEVSETALPPQQVVSSQGEMEDIPLEPALEVSVRPNAPVHVVLTGHYDTVFPEDFHFQTPERVDEQTLHGPGTADMKGGLRVMLEALKTLEAHPHRDRVGYTVLLSPDEEIGSPGSARRLAELGRRSHVGLTFEPALADGSLAGARKGSGNFALTVRGRAAHAGREHHLGRNAMAALARFAVGLDALNGQREGVTFNLAKMDGGGATNIVPELAVGRFNVRMVEMEDCDWITARLEELVKRTAGEDGITAELSGGFSRPPKPMSPANATVFDWVKRAGSALGQEIRWAPSGGVCEGNNLWASGCPNVDTLGVRGGEIHSDREYMIIPSLVERAKLAGLVLSRIADGGYDARALKAMVDGGGAA